MSRSSNGREIFTTPVVPTESGIFATPQQGRRTAALLPLTRTQLRGACQMRTSNLGEALDALITQGRVVKSADGYQLVRP